MLRDVYWRQYPVDLLNDDKMSYIESLMPEGYEFAPYMFYITALKLADDNGIFDIEDGIIFSRLMRVKDRALVFKIANYMRQNKIVYRLSDDTTLMQLADWTYSDKKARTIEDRRKIVTEAIARERAKKSNYSNSDFMPDGCVGRHNDVPQSENSCVGRHNDVPQANCCVGKCNDIPQATGTKTVEPKNEEQTAPKTGAFLLPDDDKISKNVVKTVYDDKNAKNVVNIQTDNTNSTDNTHTHTYSTTDTQQFSGYGPIEAPPPDNCQNSITAVAEIQNGNTESKDSNDSTGLNETMSLAQMALQAAQENVEEQADSALFAYLNDFFVKNCYGFEQKKSAYAISNLAKKICEVSDELNPPLEVASVLCGEFKKMCEGARSNYWKGQPLLPAYMIKPRCWMELMQYAGKILATSIKGNSFLESAEKAKAEYQAEAGKVYDAQKEELLKYKIEPDDPNATRKLLMAKSREFEAQRQQEQNVEEVGDIF